jgi:surfeit locus 1 family protein
MVARWRAAGLIVPTIFTLAVLPILIGLGTWQWQRKAWKENLISQVQSRSTAEPVSYDEALARASIPDDAEYLRVRVSGTYDHASERHVYAPARQGSGWHVYTVLKPDDGKPMLLINRGWVPEAVKDASKRPDGQIQGTVTVTGLVRAPEAKGWFTPDNDVASNRWYSRDLTGMRSSLTDAIGTEPNFAPFAIDAEAEPANPGGWPKGGTTEIRLTNSHLQYVVTWYGLALTLIGVFVAFARQRLATLRDGPSQA